MPILEKTGLVLGEGQYITHEGHVLKLRVQRFGVDSSHWIATVNDKAHVVVPVPPDEKVKEGMAFEEMAWKLIGLLLDRVNVEQGRLNELRSEMSNLKTNGDKTESLLRQAQLDLEDAKSDYNLLRMSLNDALSNLKTTSEKSERLLRQAQLDVEDAKSDQNLLRMALNSTNERMDALDEELRRVKASGEEEIRVLRKQLEEVSSGVSRPDNSNTNFEVEALRKENEAMKRRLEAAEPILAYVKFQMDSAAAEKLRKESVTAQLWLSRQEGFKVDGKWNKWVTLRAAEQGKSDVLRYLASIGQLQVHAKDQDGRTMVLISAKKGDIGVLKWIYDENLLDVYETDNMGFNVGFTAAYYGQLEVLKWLESVHLMDTNLKTSDKAKVKYLFSTKDCSGMNIAHLAALEGHLPILEWLHSMKLLDPKEGDDNRGRNIAHIAADPEGASPNVTILDWLLTSGLLDPKAKDKEGNTITSNPSRARNFQMWLRKIQ